MTTVLILTWAVALVLTVGMLVGCIAYFIARCFEVPRFFGPDEHETLHERGDR